MSALEQLGSAQKELATLEKELCQYGACDPVKVEEKKRGVTLAKEAAIRWTGTWYIWHTLLLPAFRQYVDNYVMLLAHFTRQNGVDAEELRKYLGVGEDYEDVY
jgi:hypothetical protein